MDEEEASMEKEASMDEEKNGTDQTRLVVVTYDAGTDTFTVNPNPVSIPPGKHRLYFALQTINKGDSDEAHFTEIKITNTKTEVNPVHGFGGLFMAWIENQTGSDEEPQRLSYEVHCEYDISPREPDLDPTIILQPEGMPASSS